MPEKIKFGNVEFDINNSPLKNFTKYIGFFILGLLILSSVYTVDANENAVILRLGKYNTTTGPGLQFKFPLLDKVYKVKVDYQYKDEFGFRTLRPGVKSAFSTKGYEAEAWMLTGDLKIADVRWVVQYKIKNAKDYLFNVKNVENTIRDVSESTMRLMIGDRSFKEVLQKERIAIAGEGKAQMQKVLDKYGSGIQIQMVQLQGVVPPGPVADSFNEVNRAKQEEETLVNEANQEYNRIVYNAEGLAQKLINEAGGYAVERTNKAKGDAELFNAILKEYRKAPKITEKRLFLEKMEKVFSTMENKMIIDSNLEGVLPLLNLDKEEGQE